MSYTYADRKRAESAAPRKETAPQPSMDDLRSGAAQPTAEQMGHRVDLPDTMRAKMENAFGADLSAVKLYESQAVADTGAKAITRGSDIAFAPGMLDFSSYGGQALLGHELSHVVSQARGEVTGGGFLNDSMLEARADREGAMAAAGQTVAMPTVSLSPVTAGAAAGPMQAKGKDRTMKKNAKAAALEGGEKTPYSSAQMAGSISAISPALRSAAQTQAMNDLSKGMSTQDVANDGGRYVAMRSGPLVADYAKMLRSATTNASAESVGHLFTGLKKLPMFTGEHSYKADVGSFRRDGADLSEGAAAYQQRALTETQFLLEQLEKDPDAMDALKKSQSMYSGFGTFGEQQADGSINYAGMSGGREEAAHRAMNDVLIRGTHSQFYRAKTDMTANQQATDDETRKAGDVAAAMMGMQGTVLANTLDPVRNSRMTDQELAMKDLYRSFFLRNGMIDAQAAPPASLPPEAIAATSPQRAPAASSQPGEIGRVAQIAEAVDADLPGRKRSGTIFSTL